MDLWKEEHQLSSQLSSIWLTHFYPVNKNRLLLTEQELKGIAWSLFLRYAIYGIQTNSPKMCWGKKVGLYLFRSKISLFKILSGCLSSSELASIGKHVANKSSLPKCHTDYAFASQLLEAQLDDKYYMSPRCGLAVVVWEAGQQPFLHILQK